VSNVRRVIGQRTIEKVEPVLSPIRHVTKEVRRRAEYAAGNRIGRSLGGFVQNNFLSREVIAARLHGLHIAERIAKWISDPSNSNRICGACGTSSFSSLERSAPRSSSGCAVRTAKK